MYCPTCRAIVAASDERADEQRCPICGGAMGPLATEEVVVTAGNAVVEAEGVPAGYGPCLTSYLIERELEQEQSRALVLRRTTNNAVTTLERMAALPALAWRQPAVRAAVKTGASAIALSLVVRAARSWLAQPRGQGAGKKLLPALADMLRAPEQARRGRQDPMQDEGTVVLETFIYERRVIRR